MSKTLPEFFTTKGPIATVQTQIKYGNDVYFMSKLQQSNEESINFKKHQLQPYEDNEEGVLDCEEMDDFYDINLNKSGKFFTSFYVPSSLLSHIVGARGSKLKSLQKMTGAVIKVPKVGERGQVVITGDTERKVASCRIRIFMLILEIKQKFPVSHFVSIRMVNDEIERNFNVFKDGVLKMALKGVTESIFQNVKKLHITLTILTLLDEDEEESAMKILKKSHEELKRNLLLSYSNDNYDIKLRGIEIMNDDPGEVRVLYGKVDITHGFDFIQTVADRIFENFTKSGLVKKQYDKVKLHVTLMNVSYRNSDESKENFDAAEILEKFRDFYFGKVPFKSIELSTRFATDETGYYKPLLKLDI